MIAAVLLGVVALWLLCSAVEGVIWIAMCLGYVIAAIVVVGLLVYFAAPVVRLLSGKDSP